MIKFIFLLFLLPLLVFAENSELIGNMLMNGIKVDLREPVFEEGVLKTEKGGVIEGSDIHIQAKKIYYTRKSKAGETVAHIVAEDDLIVEFNQYVFVGKRLEYDFSTRSGILYEGRTAIEPWFFGGERVYLHADGSYTIDEAFVTTSENYNAEWGIYAEKAEITKFHLLSAKNVQFRACRVPLLKLPYFRANLSSIFDQPIRYEARAGSQGPRVSVAYEVFSWNGLKTFARLDYRLKRGWGGGIEHYYHSADRNERFESVNFIAKDAKSTTHRVKTRYRFQGAYSREIVEKKISIDLTYDKLSDKRMATDYKERGLDIEAAGRTQLLARKETDLWITSFLTRARLNSFQTIKQELPTLETNIIPFEIANTGIISTNEFKASYLDFRYANNVRKDKDNCSRGFANDCCFKRHGNDNCSTRFSNGYRSTRLATSQRLYRPFRLKQMTITPEIGGVAILEGNSPESHPSFVSVGILACEANTRLYRFYENTKHVLSPFARYEYYSYPTIAPPKHYIFDIDDGWYRLNMFRFGLDQNFYFKDQNGLINRYLKADISANAFFDTDRIPLTVPKVYTHLVWNSFYRMQHTCRAGWDFEKKRLDHFNLRTDWTINADLAIAAEYRHRSAYDFRKADPYNFFVDAFHTLEQMRHSAMSDRRDTLLVHMFYRLHPNWAVEFESRYGWNRQCEPNYTEFEIDLYGTLWSAWNIKLAYQKLEDDDRFTCSISLGLKPPDKSKYEAFVPRLQF